MHKAGAGGQAVHAACHSGMVEVDNREAG
eukprot:COSAG06_NODE_6292_length_2995_cov_3.199240_1_plen_28_part_10